MIVCHWNDVCKHSNGSEYVGGYCGLSESGQLCLVGFLVVYKCSSVLLQSIVMSYVDCSDDG